MVGDAVGRLEVGDDVRAGVDGRLHVVGHLEAAARLHELRVGVGERELGEALRLHLLPVALIAGEPLLGLGELPLELGAGKPARGHGVVLGVLLVEQPQVLADVALEAGYPVVELGRGEVAVLGVGGAHLRAVHGPEAGLHAGHDAGHELPEHALERRGVVATEVRDGAEVGGQRADEPHDLDVDLAGAGELARRAYAVAVAVHVELEQVGGLVRGAAAIRGLRTVEAHRVQVERADEGVDHAGLAVGRHHVVERREHHLVPVAA